MTTSAKTSRVSLLAAGRACWAWWLGEMRALVPAHWRSERRRRLDGAIHLGRDTWTIRQRGGATITVDPRDGPAVAQAFDVLKGRRKRAKVSATIPLSRCFVRRTEMPRAMMGHAASVLASELDAVTPFQGGSAHWDWLVQGPGAAPATLAIMQVVLKRRDTESVLDRLADAGVNLSFLSVEDDGASPPRRLSINLLRHDRGVGSPQPGLRSGRRLLTAAAAVACLAIVPTAFSQQASTLSALDQDLDEARQATALRGGVARASLQTLGAALQSKRDMPPTDLVLDRLAALLPPDSSLDHLFLDRNVVTIQGRTTSIRAFEHALAASPLFSAGHNTAESSGTGDVPFTIRLKLRPKPAEPDA